MKDKQVYDITVLCVCVWGGGGGGLNITSESGGRFSRDRMATPALFNTTDF
jgi:hypothetical protein